MQDTFAAVLHQHRLRPLDQATPRCIRSAVLIGNGLDNLYSKTAKYYIEGYAGYQKHRDNKMLHAWCVLSGRFVAFVLAIALVVPVPAMQAGAMPHEDTSGVSVSFTASEGAASLSNHALVCHMHFEHHQLVRAENAVVMPAPDSVRARYLTGVKSLTSFQPAPLRRPPRA
jgi:hypothetical protein